VILKKYLKGLKFVAVFALAALSSYLLLSLLFSKAFAAIAAYSSQFILSLLGVSSSISFAENPHLISPLFDAELVNLCWGLVEMAVVTGLVLASDDRKIFDRAWGALLGIISVLFFNALRIAVTLKLFNPVEPFASAIAHDLLFRISLVLVIVGYYAFWYVFLTAKFMKNKAVV